MMPIFDEYILNYCTKARIIAILSSALRVMLSKTMLLQGHRTGRQAQCSISRLAFMFQNLLRVLVSLRISALSECRQPVSCGVRKLSHRLRLYAIFPMA